MMDNEGYSDDSLFNISSWGADLTFRELVQMYHENDLVKPEFQRNYVWKKTEASRFIESILLGLPVPSIFLANAANKQMLIIDGYQRIMTVYDYIFKKKFSGENVLFRLTNTKAINKRWRNKAFDELCPEDQRQLRNSTIHAIIFEQKLPQDDDTSMFQIFSRINTSGKTLNAQEIRNCVCQGEFNSVLMELNRYPKWRELYGDAKPDNRMLDMELILRFFAIRDLRRMKAEKRQINLRRYLDLYMRNCSGEGLRDYKNWFVAMVDFAYDKLGVEAFLTMSATVTGNGRGKRRPNPVIFESLSVAISLFLEGGGVAVGTDLNARKAELLANEEFIAASTKRTTDVANIEKRIALTRCILLGDER